MNQAQKAFAPAPGKPPLRFITKVPPPILYTTPGSLQLLYASAYVEGA